MAGLDFDRFVVDTDNLFLDPNNLRLSEVDEEMTATREEEVMDPGVQEETLARVCREENIDDLQRSILHTRGPVDAPIVVHISDEDDEHFMVLEGNRRVACVKRLLRRIDDEVLGEEYRTDLEKVTVLLLPREVDNEQNRRLILGTRHVTGVKPWIPYQRAIVIKQFKEEEGKSSREIADILGMKPREVTELYRALNAFNDFCRKTGSRDTRKFSYFVEAVGKASIQNWLGMNDDGRFEKEERHELYEWILGDEETQPKIEKAEQIRPLAKIILNEEALDEFMSEDGSIDSAMEIVKQYLPPAWIPTFRKTIRIIRNLPGTIIEDIPQNPSQVQLVDELAEQVSWLKETIRSRSTRSTTRPPTD